MNEWFTNSHLIMINFCCKSLTSKETKQNTVCIVDEPSSQSDVDALHVDGDAHHFPPLSSLHARATRPAEMESLLSPPRQRSNAALTLRAYTRVCVRIYARIRSCPYCHKPMAALSLVVNINEKMDSERLVEAVRARPISYESNTKSYQDADKKAAA